MTYKAPIEEMRFLLNSVLDIRQLYQTDQFADVSDDVVAAILAEAAKVSEQALAPLNREGDLFAARLDNGVVKTAPGFVSGYAAIAEGGWVGITAQPDYGGMGLPMALGSCVTEMMTSACFSLALKPMLTQGQIDALEHHASDELKTLYLPKLNSGEWSGTMNLTEAHAGSDVGALRSKAIENPDGTCQITGQKVFISWGDSDLTENICHLVLARLSDGAAGTKGLSLFLVPKFLPNEDGRPGEPNAVKTVSLEHKLGLHGSPTAVLSFESAKGWIVGAPHKGMAAMFTMMNTARLGVAVQGLSQAEGAYQKALAFALERVQGASLVEDGTGTILDHADIRRMIMTMKVLTSSARALCLDTAKSLDLSRATGVKAWHDRTAFLTPIAKAFSTSIGCEVAELGMQVHGGMGYVEETGAAQFYRDARVTPIYEGTNGIQGIDLVDRKLRDGGETARTLLAEIKETAVRGEDRWPESARQLHAAHDAVEAALDGLLKARTLNDRFAGATPFLRAFALILGGHYLLRAALADQGEKWAPLARFMNKQIVPQVPGLCAAATVPAHDLYELHPETLTEA